MYECFRRWVLRGDRLVAGIPLHNRVCLQLLLRRVRRRVETRIYIYSTECMYISIRFPTVIGLAASKGAST